MNNAAAGCHLEVVKWLYSKRTEGCTVDAMDRAAKSGHFQGLKWLHKHRQERSSTAAIYGAAGIGRLNSIGWLIEEVCGCECTEQAFGKRGEEWPF